MKKAIEYFDRALAILKSLHGKYHYDVGDLYWKIADAYNKIKDYKKAIEYY